MALLVLVVLVVAGWTGAWFWAKDRVLGEMDQAIARLAQDGVEVSCPDRAVGGWPFRMEVTCETPVARLRDGGTLAAEAVAAVWHVMDPKLVLVFAEGPLTVEGERGRAVTTFETLRASLRLEDLRTGRVSVMAEKPVTVVTGPEAAADDLAELAADRAELHLRQVPGHDGDFDLAATVTGLDGATYGAPLLPAPASAGVNLTLTKAVALDGTPGGYARWAAAGGMLTITEAVLEVGGTTIRAEGAATVEPDGRPKATLDAVGSDVEWLTAAVKAGKPVPPPLAALGSAFLLLGRPVEGEGSPKALTISVDEGAVTANGLPLGTVPPLFSGGS